MTLPSSPISRRRFLRASAAWGSLVSFGSVMAGCSPGRGPFSLGVASGDPLPDGVVLWTRLAPDPLDGGGMPPTAAEVGWEIARDDAFQRVVRRGRAIASPLTGHSVHVDVRGLLPSSWYWYRFRAGSELSPVGRTKTAPLPASDPKQVTFAFASCQNYEHGLFVGYSNMAEDDLDFVVHLGDYIYEAEAHTAGERAHGDHECIALRDYRNRYALYKSDPGLQVAHASFPFVVTFDDHEVEDNYAADGPKEGSDTPARRRFLQRRSNAYRAYWEHMPLRRASLPRGPNMRLFRRLDFARLLSMNVLDTRQYRTDQPCGDGVRAPCASVFDPEATMMGPLQERWLLRGLDRSEARWNVIAQQTLFSRLLLDPDAGGLLSMDQWDGYRAARQRLTTFLADRSVRNPIVITGDTHASWVNEVRKDFDHPDSPVVASEFGGPSITSRLPTDSLARIEAALAYNPHVRYFEGTQHGYVRCEVKRERFRADYRVVSNVWSPQATASTLASFEVTDGTPVPVRLA